MNILFVSPNYNPLNGIGWGATQRNNLLFDACTQLGHVDVVTFVNDVVSSRDNITVLYSKSDKSSIHKEGRLTKFLQMLVPWNPYAMFPKNSHRTTVVRYFIKKKKYDLIVCRYIPSAMECGLLDYAGQLVIDVDDNPLDVERTAYHNSRTFRNRIYHHYRAIVLGYVLRRIQNKCLFTFYSNPTQATYRNSAYLPNIPFYYYDLKTVEYSRTTKRILFVGNMSYGPNIYGVLHFIKNILPIVIQKIPDAELHLVGGCNNEPFLKQCSNTNGVKYMGFVDDLEEEYCQARVVAAPIYGGAGTNIKILEAMKMNRPCVTTVYGVRGFSDYFQFGQEILVAENDQQFADALVDMLIDENKNHAISYWAHLAVTAHFSRERFNSIVKESLSKC